MSQKTKKQLQKELKELSSEKEQLLQAKQAEGKDFPKEKQARLSEVTEAIVDLEEQIELAPDDEKKETTATSEVAKGTEKLVQVMLSHGKRFDPHTGKEINKPVPQSFNYGEWQLFKKNYKLLGYTITDVINDPFGDAKELIKK